jgi:TPP-dependent pyruvate/acetoin dehydrogenase alpha subunit
MDEAVQAEVADALTFADESPDPEPDALYTHVYQD